MSTKHNTRGHYEKIPNLNNTLLLLVGILPKKNDFSIPEHFFNILDRACSLYLVTNLEN
jgi:hypothetical protein